MLYESKFKGFPTFRASGTFKESKKFLVMSKHGFDLNTIHKILNKKFTYKTVLNIGIELVISLFVLYFYIIA